MVEPGSNGSERLLTLLLNSTTGPVTLFSVYAPTLSTTPDTKDMFYKNLASIIRNILSKEQIVVLGNFSARVGADHDLWPSCLGQFGVGKMNENGQWLLELCTFHDLCITNSFFCTKPQHRVSWRHPHSKHWHQLVLILVRCAAIKNVLHTRSYHSVDCYTDYSLVCCKIRMQPKKFHRTKTRGIPCIDVSKMSQPDLMEQFAQTFKKEFGSLQSGDSATEKWEALHDTILRCFGYLWEEVLKITWLVRSQINCDDPRCWSQVSCPRRVQTHSQWEEPTDSQDCQEQGSTDCSALHKYWTELSRNIQSVAITGNIRGMYDGIRKALEPTLNKSAPLRSSAGEVITDRGHQLERWVEHYSDIYSRENTVSPSALDAVECLLTVEELDTKSTLEELSKAINRLASRKAPGSDRIPPQT